MAGQSPSAKSSTAPRHAPAWLPLAAVSILLIVVPIAVYLFFYRASRIEDATIRNLRALDAAADRVDAVTTRLPTVVTGSSFGVSVGMLDELTERLTGEATRHWTLHETGCSDGNGPLSSKGQTDSRLTDLHDLLHMQEPAEQLRLEFRYRLAVHLLSRSNERTRELWNQLYCLLKKHRQYSLPVETITVDVDPLSRIPLRSWPFSGYCAAMFHADCDRVRKWLESEQCSKSTQTTKLSGGSMLVTDCRPLRERHRDLHATLHAWTKAHETQVAEELIQVLDLFGIKSTVKLDELLTNATEHLSRFFDSHLIADGEGRILFEADASSTPATEVDESHVETPAFSNHVDILALLRVPPARGAEDGNGTPLRARRSAENDGAARSSAEPHRSESFVETMSIGNIDLRAFVHPFIPNVNGGDSERNSQESRALQTFYIIGIVDSNEFESEAIRLRLSLVSNATLIVLVILTLCPLFWFWTAGDRLTLGPWPLAGVCAAPVVGVVLFVVLVCGMVTNRIDERVLDDTMKKVADRVVHLFDWELHKEIVDLHRAVPTLRKTQNPRDTDGWEKLNELEKKFYCDKSGRDLAYKPGKYRENSFLIDENGRQAACLSDGRLTRTPKLSLAFREYFKQPKEGALWRPKRVAPPPEPRCRLSMATDEESLIPCLIPSPIESWRRLHEREPWHWLASVTLRTLLLRLLDHVRSAGLHESTLSLLSSNPKVPYFLERIDSVVRGDVQTVLAISTECAEPLTGAGCDKRLVAAAAARLNSLNRAVPPSHVDIAVVDRRTGRTLFHSDDDLAMATNFADDVGGDPALWTLLRAGGSDTISLVYAGIPVRAHVRPLREGMPWALIVYRGHEIEDRLTSVTTALAAFFTLLPLFVLTILAGVVLYITYLCKCAWVASLPICLGRVMAAGSCFRSVGSGFRWATWGVVTVLTLTFLVWIQSSLITAVVSLLTQELLPSLAVGSVLAVSLFLARLIRLQTTGSDGRARLGDTATVWQVLVLSLVIVFLGALPAGLWFSHHRAALGAGLNHYLVDRTLESMDQAREEFRVERLREYGGGVAGPDDRSSEQSFVKHAEGRPGENWIYAQLLEMLRPVVGLSRLSNDLMVYRTLPPAPAVGVASLHDVFAGTFGYDVGPWGRLHLGHVFLESVVWLLLAAALIGFIAHSIRTIVTRRDGEPICDTDLIRDKCLSSKSDRLSRAVVLSRNPENRDSFIKLVIEKSAFKCSYRHKWNGRRIQWEPMFGQCSDASRPLYVFDDVEKVLERSAEGRALFAELESKMDAGIPVLVWSPVVHDYRYSERFGPVDTWFRRGSLDDADRRRRWERLASRLHGRVLGISHPPCLVSESERLQERSTFDVSEFERLWGQSTFDERLELQALARGGVAGSRRPTARATLSSLKKRGLVKVDGMGVVQWSCKKLGKEFGEFIRRDADRQELATWQREGRGGLWRVLWPPLLIGAALILAFLFFANPEMQSTLLALLGILPALLALFRRSGVSGSVNGDQVSTS